MQYAYIYSSGNTFGRYHYDSADRYRNEHCVHLFHSWLGKGLAFFLSVKKQQRGKVQNSTISKHQNIQHDQAQNIFAFPMS